MRRYLRYIAATTILFGFSSVASAECRAVDESGKESLLGQFEFEYAYRDCLRVYKNRYLPKHGDTDSELKLQCRGRSQSIAFFKDGRFYETGIKVAGCAMSKTMG